MFLPVILDASSPPPSLDSTFGAFMLGTCFGAMFFGLTLHQTYRYFFTSKKSDTAFVKSLVISLVLLDTLHTASCIHASYYHLVRNYFNPSSLGSATSVPHRRNMEVQESGLLVYTTPSLAEFAKYSWIVSTISGLAVSCDTLLTGTLIYILLRNRTEFNHTNSLIDLLVLYAVTTGFISLIVMVFIFVFGLILPGNLIYISIGILGTKLYSNSVLASLNAREGLASKLERDAENIDIRLSAIQTAKSANIHAPESGPKPATPRFEASSRFYETSSLMFAQSGASTLDRWSDNAGLDAPTKNGGAISIVE
ncbi:hypothetical protein OH77DRAFT_837221 [Trametes cingulata]|nr:hypothetical protein OH77DRAFT_837221 [Trametes cingulata]